MIVIGRLIKLHDYRLSLHYLFLGRALCLSHHFIDLANEEVFALSSVQLSRGKSVFILLNPVSDPTILHSDYRLIGDEFQSNIEQG